MWSCTCPVGDDGECCKHCVAVGLVWLEQANAGGRSSVPRVQPSTTTDAIRAWLAGREKRELVELLEEQLAMDDRLRRRLALKAARKPGKLDIDAWRKAIDEAVSTNGFVDYHAAGGYASGIDDTIDQVEQLLKQGHAGEVVDLAEYGLRAVEGAIESVDDSDGYLGEILARLQDLHLAACRRARPDPEQLARRLFAWEMRTDWDTFFDAAATYAGVLRKPGLAVYRKLAEAQWARVPALEPGEDRRAELGTRFRLTQIMEALARQTGDVEAVVAVKQRDLSSAYAFLEIAELYRRARNPDQALVWAERGVKVFPEHTDPRLREFLADEYQRRGRHQEAMALAWADFADRPVLDGYQALKRHADRAGEWPAWRDRAHGFMRQSAPEAQRRTKASRWAWSVPADRSDLVRVFLWENDVEAAWREAREGGCSDDLWRQLAAKREKAHPDDATVVYQRLIEPTLARKNVAAYREGVELLRKIRAMLIRLGRQDEWQTYLGSVRAAHRAKRNFMQLLDGARWR